MLLRLLQALPDELERFQRLAAKVVEWEALLEAADRHGVRGPLYEQLRAGPSVLPPLLRKRAERQRAFDALPQLRLQAVLDQVLAALTAADVRAVMLKGPVLGERLYGVPTLRISNDLDVLVAPDDLGPAQQALEKLAYQAEAEPTAAYEREHHHHLRLLRPRSPAIDLHFRAHARFGVIVAAEPLLTRAIPYRTARGQWTWVLAPEDEFLYLAVHAAGHCFSELSLLYDLKLFLRRHPTLDWSVVASRAQSLRLVAAISFACAMLQSPLDVAIPLQNGLPYPRRWRRRLADALLAASSAHQAPAPLATLARIAFQALLCDGVAAAGRSLRRRLAWEVRAQIGRHCRRKDHLQKSARL